MTNKINSIDVSECPLFDKKTGCYHTFDGECAKDSCAVYKWLLEHKRLQEENEKQKEQIKQLEDFIKSDGEIDHINHEYTYKLQKENEELKGKIDIYENSIIANHDRAIGKRLMEVLMALEEIRKYCEEQNLKADYTACEVLTIIDEVQNENKERKR